MFSGVTLPPFRSILEWNTFFKHNLDHSQVKKVSGRVLQAKIRLAKPRGKFCKSYLLPSAAISFLINTRFP